MKFDVVIGNPPYNGDMYLEFIRLGKKLASGYVSMIVPAKWQAKLDKDNISFREDIVPYISEIVHFRNSQDIFDIKELSGVCYFLLGKEKAATKMVKTVCEKNKYLECDFEEHDEESVILYSHKILSIVGKVGLLERGFDNSKYVRNTRARPNCITNSIGFDRSVFVGETDTGEEVKKDGYVDVMQGGEVVGYKAIKDLYTTKNLEKYKCTCSSMSASLSDYNKQGKTRGYIKTHILKPYQVPKGSFISLVYFDTYEECESFISYMSSKLVGFLAYIGNCGITLTSSFYRYIPDEKFNHIFTDDELYVKYGLTADEIEIIEGIIR